MNERRIEREEARSIMEIHLDMYIPPRTDALAGSSFNSQDLFYDPPIP